jgi:hypothetical protein
MRLRLILLNILLLLVAVGVVVTPLEGVVLGVLELVQIYK